MVGDDSIRLCKGVAMTILFTLTLTVHVTLLSTGMVKQPTLSFGPYSARECADLARKMSRSYIQADRASFERLGAKYTVTVDCNPND